MINTNNKVLVSDIVKKTKYPIRYVGAKHNKNEVADHYLSQIKEYKDAYKEEFYNKLITGYTVSAFYVPFISLYGGNRNVTVKYSYTYSKTENERYEITETTQDVYYNEYGMEVSRGNAQTRTYYEDRPKTEYYTGYGEKKLPLGYLIFKYINPYDIESYLGDLYSNSYDLTKDCYDVACVDCNPESLTSNYNFFNGYNADLDRYCKRQLNYSEHYQGNTASDLVLYKTVVLVPYAELISFDGKTKFYLNMYTGEITGDSYAGQDEYMKPDYKAKRDKARKHSINKFKRRYTLFSILTLIICYFALIVPLNLFNDELYLHKCYIDFLYKIFDSDSNAPHIINYIITGILSLAPVAYVFYHFISYFKKRKELIKYINTSYLLDSVEVEYKSAVKHGIYIPFYIFLGICAFVNIIGIIISIL